MSRPARDVATPAGHLRCVRGCERLCPTLFGTLCAAFWVKAAHGILQRGTWPESRQSLDVACTALIRLTDGAGGCLSYAT